MNQLAPIAQSVARRPLDPHIVNVLFDTDAFDRQGELRPEVGRLFALRDAGKIKLVAPAGVFTQIGHPNTPVSVRQRMVFQSHTIAVERNSQELRAAAAVRTILRGNSTAAKHDADADNLFEAQKYGTYFITHDQRIYVAKRCELLEVFPDLWIITLAEFFEIYDDFEAGRLL